MTITLLAIRYRTIRRSIDSRLGHTNYTGSESKRVIETRKKKNLKMIVILVVMCSIYSVTYLAFTIYRIAGNYMVLDRKTQTMIELILILVYVVSSMLNPIITLAFKEDYRKILCCCFKRKVSSASKPAAAIKTKESNETQESDNATDETQNTNV